MQTHEVLYVPVYWGHLPHTPCRVVGSGTNDPQHRIETAFIGLQQSLCILNQSPRNIQCGPLNLKHPSPLLAQEVCFHTGFWVFIHSQAVVNIKVGDPQLGT